jgi:hypothetical protein
MMKTGKIYGNVISKHFGTTVAIYVGRLRLHLAFFLCENKKDIYR